MPLTVLEQKPWNDVDGPSLARAAAALQLIPENASRLVRLQRLAGAAACLPHRPDAPRLSPSRVRALLKTPLIGNSDVRAQEDPYDDLYTCEVAFHGGPYVVAQGLTSRSAYTLDLLLHSIFGPDINTLPRQFVQDARILTHTTLSLSHQMLGRGGLRRGIVVPPPRNAEVFVPGAAELSRLCEAVTFDLRAWQALTPEEAAPLLDPLLVQPGEHTFPAGPGPDEALVLTPLLVTPDSIIVINPGELAAALRHRLIVLAGAHDCRTQLAALVRREVVQRVTRTLVQCDASPAGPEFHSNDAPLSRCLFRIADDKFIDLAVIVDDLSEYDDHNPYGTWEAPELDQRVQDLLDPPGKPTEQDARTLRLVVHQSAGRAMAFGLGQPRRPGPFLVLTADDLEVMADLDGADPLFLWRFAQAERTLRDHTRVLSFSTLDTYGLYRDHAYSFYLSDGPRPHLITVDSDFSTGLRSQAHQRVDRHEVACPRRSVLVPVVAVHGTDTAPIYRTALGPRETELVIELVDVLVWVTAAASHLPELDTVNGQFLEAVAYWTWQLSAVSPDLLNAAADDDGNLVIGVSFDDPQAWADALAGEEPDAGSGSWVRASGGAPGHLELTLSVEGWSSLLQDANGPDRALVRALASAAATAADAADTTDIDQVVERVAPYGAKKMVHVSSADPLLLAPSSLPPARLVQSAVAAQVSDDLGQWLSKDGMPRGPVAPDRRLAVLNKVVGRYFQLLQDKFAQLSPEGLLSQLLQQHEALLHAEAVSRHNLPARIACFGPSSQPVQELARINRERVVAAQASRFLIEYAAAVPPGGSHSLTLDRYDHLMAIAADLISRAMLSDAIRHEFSDVNLSLLDSGRLGTSRGDRFESGTNTLALARAEAVLHGAAQNVATPAEQLTTAPTRTVEDAMTAEFGFTLTELGEGIGTLIALGRDHNPSGPVLLPASDVKQHLQTTLSWPADKTEAFLDRLSLQPRTDFLAVKADAWPWRFNRAWSYARRPLIRVRSNESDSLAWAPRHLWSTSTYWFELVYSGRLRAESAAMKTLMGSIRQDNNKDFEKQVETALAQGGCSTTARGVAKIAGRRLTIEGNDLGDIDALGFSPQHKKIFVAEAKDFEMARNPAELANEADHLLRGDKSARYKIIRRAQWIRTHLAITLRHFRQGSDIRGWSVIPIVVTSRDLMAPRVMQSDVPVVPITKVVEWVRQEAIRPQRRSRTPRL